MSSSSFRVDPKKIAEAFMDIDKYDVVQYADRLSQKDILIIGGWQDQGTDIEHHMLPLIRALQKHQAKQVQIEIFDTDHSFANVRSQLSDRIISWLNNAH